MEPEATIAINLVMPDIGHGKEEVLQVRFIGQRLREVGVHCPNVALAS